MSGQGPEAVLYDIDGDPMAIENGTAIPPLTSSLIGAGSDGTYARFIKVNSDGYQIVIGSGIAGTPSLGVITIQGDPAGTPIPISGNITASNASVGTNDSAIPGFSTLIGGSDGTNLRSLRVFDLDSGGGQQWVLGVGLRKASGGGSVELGTSSDPIRIDPTGTTTQPTSATQSGTWTVQPGNTANTTPWLITINQGGNSATVTASNALKVDGSAVTQPVSGTVTANAGTGNFTVVQSTASNLRAQLASESTTGSAIPSTAVMVGGSDGTNLRALFVDSSGRQFVVGAAANGAAVAGNPVLIAGSDGTNARSIRTATDGTVRVDPTGTTTQPVSGTVAATQSGTWTVQPGNTANTTPWLTTINQGGNSATVTASNALKVDGSAVTQPVSGTVTSNQGTAAALSGAWPVKVTDGTNTMPTGDAVGRAIFEKITDGTNTVAVKAASTAATATDPSLVTAFSPNSPLPTGSNTIGAVTQASGPWTENLTQVASSAVATAATGVQKVGIVGGTGTSLETTAGVLDYNLKNVANSAVSTAATGVQKVGVVGNAGATTDATMAAGTAPTNGYGTLAQYNTTQPAPTNTQTVSAQSDQSGNLLQFPGVQTKTGAVWNSSTTINTLQFSTGTATIGAPLGALSILVQLNQTSTLTAGAVTFQGTYDGTNWVSIPTAQILHPQTLVQLTNPYTFVASTNQPFLIQLQGFQQVRLNLTSTITGTGSVTPFWTVLSNPPTQAVTTLSGGYGGQIEGRAADGATPVGNPVYVAGTDGTNIQAILTDTLGRIITAPSGAATAAGFSFGDIALSAITTSAVRRTTYNEQSSNAQRSIASSSASDTSAGTGARQVKITYYDSTGAGPSTETVTLNGTTAVATVSSTICFIEQMEVVSVGSGGSNAGTITLFVNNAGGGGTIGTIATGDNETYWAHHYVPSGKTNYITSLSVVVNGGGALFYVKAKATGVATAVEAQITDYVRSATQSGTSTRPYGTAIQTPGPARLLMYVTTEANTSLTYRGAFDYYDQ